MKQYTRLCNCPNCKTNNCPAGIELAEAQAQLEEQKNKTEYAEKAWSEDIELLNRRIAEARKDAERYRIIIIQNGNDLELQRALDDIAIAKWIELYPNEDANGKSIAAQEKKDE